MRSIRVILSSVVLMLCQRGVAQEVVAVKQVVAPPGDIESGVVRLPDPVDLGVSSRTVLYAVDPRDADEDGIVGFGFPQVLGDGAARVVFLPDEHDAWEGLVTFMDFEAQQETLIRTDERIEDAGATRVRHPLPWGDPGRVFDAVVLPGSQDAMAIEIRLKKPVGGFVLIDPRPDRALYTYVKQRRTLVGQPITLVSSLSDGSKIVELTGVVRSPDGTRELMAAGIDAAELSFTPRQPGAYSVQVYGAYASDANRAIVNAPVVLSTQHLIRVEEPSAPLGGVRVAARDGLLELSFADADRDDRVIVCAEVWGRADGELVPIIWLARVCDGRRSLYMDPGELRRGGVDPGSVELRAVRVHDVDSMVPTQIIDRIAAPIDRVLIPDLPAGIDMGSVPIRVASGRASSNARGTLPGGHRLLLVHGYCSDGNPFTTSHFTGDIALFSDPQANRSHDAFALEILAQTGAMKSFGVAGHSQGAMAALHLYTFYFSGLDWARGDRLIQSVGAPYQGTPLAGNAAVLGDLFGSGCGENSDMTPAGAANWLSLIPTSSREQVWYATTAFENRPFAFDYCNIITDLLLSDPDDGVIERSRGQLPGANSMGHVEGWCHTSGMRDPAQTTDASRNNEIDARARR